MTADVRTLQPSSGSLNGEDTAPRRRHGPAQHVTQGNPTDSPALHRPLPGAHTLQHVAASDDEETSDDGEQQLLSSGGRASGRSQTRRPAADSGPAYELAFDGIEAADGQPSGAGGSGSGALSRLFRRRLPGLALFWDGITPELIAVSMGGFMHCTVDMHRPALQTCWPLA